MARLRWCILQTVLLAALVALWLNYPNFLNGHWPVAGVAVIACIGLWLVFIRRLEGAAKLQDMLPVVAVVAMQVGILLALGVMAEAMMSAGDPMKAVGGFFSALSTALYVSVASLISYLWLRINLWLCHGE